MLLLKKITLTAYTLLLVFPLLIAAEESAQDILSKSNYSPEERSSISGIFETAGNNGIAESYLLPRLKEARAKRVPASRLIAALRKEVEHLITARKILLDSREGKKLLKADAPVQRAANLLSWGASPEEIRMIVRAAGPEAERFQSTTYLFVSLSDWGLERNTALQLTAAVADSQIDAKDFPGILELLIRSRRGSRTPVEESKKIMELLPLVPDFTELKERIYYE